MNRSTLKAPSRIQRKRTKGWRTPANTVYVGRPTKWGNPFLVDVWVGGGMQTREKAVRLFRLSIPADGPGSLPFTRADVVRELRGKNLACWCRPGDACHADVLLRIANAARAS